MNIGENNLPIDYDSSVIDVDNEKYGNQYEYDGFKIGVRNLPSLLYF